MPADKMGRAAAGPRSWFTRRLLFRKILWRFGSMSVTPTSSEIFIQGLTRAGRTFRPSDWAERLAGVMAPFRPGGASGPGAHLGYSPWCRPTVIDGIKCVVVNRALREHEPMAWDFVINFARDNDLQTVEACLLADEPPRVPK